MKASLLFFALLLAPLAALHAADAPTRARRSITAAMEKTLVDYFLPMEPQEPLVSEGIWGNTNVLPRDIKNGLEDPKLEKWCYWDIDVHKGRDGANDNHASKIVVVPFDGKTFGRDMQKRVTAEKVEKMTTDPVLPSHPDPTRWKLVSLDAGFSRKVGEFGEGWIEVEKFDSVLALHALLLAGN